MSISLFVVEDEPKAQSNIRHAISNVSDWEVTRCYSSGENVVQDVELLSPDILFLDIQLPGEDGLSIARSVLQLPSPPLIVFITAFSQHAVTAFELYAIDYLLKPFDDARMLQCVQKIEQTLGNTKQYKQQLAAQGAWAERKPLQHIVINSSNRMQIIPSEEVTYLASNGNYVDIHHKNGVQLIRSSLKQMLTCFSANEFIQIHRGYAVRESLIREVYKGNEDKFSVTLNSGEQLPVGNTYKQSLMQRLIKAQ